MTQIQLSKEQALQTLIDMAKMVQLNYDGNELRNQCFQVVVTEFNRLTAIDKMMEAQAEKTVKAVLPTKPAPLKEETKVA